jgi:hypothetical protein
MNGILMQMVIRRWAGLAIRRLKIRFTTDSGMGVQTCLLGHMQHETHVNRQSGLENALGGFLPI